MNLIGIKFRLDNFKMNNKIKKIIYKNVNFLKLKIQIFRENFLNKFNNKINYYNNVKIPKNNYNKINNKQMK